MSFGREPGWELGAGSWDCIGVCGFYGRFAGEITVIEIYCTIYRSDRQSGTQERRATEIDRVRFV